MAKVDFELASLYYNGYDYKNVVLDAALKDRELAGELWSDNQELNLGMKFRLRADENACKINLNGDIKNVDLKGLHFMSENMAFSLGLNVDAELKADSTSSLRADFFEYCFAGSLLPVSWEIWILLSPVCETRRCWMSRRET